MPDGLLDPERFKIKRTGGELPLSPVKPEDIAAAAGLLGKRPQDFLIGQGGQRWGPTVALPVDRRPIFDPPVVGGWGDSYPLAGDPGAFVDPMDPHGPLGGDPWGVRIKGELGASGSGISVESLELTIDLIKVLKKAGVIK